MVFSAGTVIPPTSCTLVCVWLWLHRQGIRSPAWDSVHWRDNLFGCLARLRGAACPSPSGWLLAPQARSASRHSMSGATR